MDANHSEFAESIRAILETKLHGIRERRSRDEQFPALLGQGHVCALKDGSMALGRPDPVNQPRGIGLVDVTGGMSGILHWDRNEARRVCGIWNAAAPPNVGVQVEVVHVRDLLRIREESLVSLLEYLDQNPVRPNVVDAEPDA